MGVINNVYATCMFCFIVDDMVSMGTSIIACVDMCVVYCDNKQVRKRVLMPRRPTIVQLMLDVVLLSSAGPPLLKQGRGGGGGMLYLKQTTNWFDPNGNKASLYP